MTVPDQQLDDLIAEYLQLIDEDIAIDAREFIADYPNELQREFLKYLQLEEGIYRLNALGEIGCDSSSGKLRIRPSPSEASGDEVGGYRLLSKISQGGMGIVYLGQDIETDELVAVKLLRGAIRNEPSYQRRLERESRAIAALHHPHVVQPIASGVDQGATYLAMQLIDGVGMDHIIQHWRQADERDLSSEARICEAKQTSTPLTHVETSVCAARLEADRFLRIAELLADIADGLHAAHEKGIVHRDVKPSNILVDVHGKAWLTDFGLAIVGEDETELTQTGDILGTPAYMSPEQASGRRRQIDRASDIFSLGVTLYELATLRKPFSGTRQKIIHDLLEGKFTLPSKIRSELPKALEAIICHAMELEPRNRYASAQSFASDLRRFAEGERVQANLPGRIQQSLRWCERNPLTTMVTVAGVLLAAGVAFSVQTVNSWSLSKLNAKLSSTNEQLIDANRDLDESQARLLRELYVADMHSAFEAFNKQDLPATQMLLERYRSDVDTPRPMPQRLLEALIQPPLSRILCQHDAAATQLFLAEDHSYVLSAGHDGQVIQSTLEGKIRSRFQVGGKLDALAVDSQSAAFLTGVNIPEGYNQVNFYDLKTGDIVGKGSELWYGVEEVTVAPSGNWYAAAERYQDVVVFDKDGVVRGRWSTESRNESLEFIDDDHVLGVVQVAPSARSLYLWNLQTDEAKLVAANAECFELSRDEKGTPRFVVVASSNGLKLYEWKNATIADEPVALVADLPSRIRCVDISADSKHILAGCDDGSVAIWQTMVHKDGRLLPAKMIPISEQRITDIQSVIPTGSRQDTSTAMHSGLSGSMQFLTSSEDGLVQLHSLPIPNPRTLQARPEPAVGKLANPFRDAQDSQLLYLPFRRGELVCLDTATLQFRTIYQHDGEVEQGCCTRQRIYLANSTAITEIDRSTGRRLREFATVEPRTRCDSLVVVGQTLFAGYRGNLLSFDLAGSPDTPQVRPLPFENTTDLLATGVEAYPLLIVSHQAKLELGADGKLHTRESINAIKDSFGCLQASSDNQLLATARHTDVIEVTNRQGERISTLSGHRQGITDMEFTDNNRGLMSVAYDGTIRFWDLATEREMGRLEIPEFFPDFLFHFPEQSLMLTVHREGAVQAWRTRPP